MGKNAAVVRMAEIAAEHVDTWADLSNVLFSPGCICARVFPTREDRERFFGTGQYDTVMAVLDGAMCCYGIVEGATPKVMPPMLLLERLMEDAEFAEQMLLAMEGK